MSFVKSMTKFEQNVCYFANDNFKFIFKPYFFLIKIIISLTFALKFSMGNKATLFLVMTWCQTGDSETITWHNDGNTMAQQDMISPHYIDLCVCNWITYSKYIAYVAFNLFIIIVVEVLWKAQLANKFVWFRSGEWNRSLALHAFYSFACDNSNGSYGSIFEIAFSAEHQ